MIMRWLPAVLLLLLVAPLAADEPTIRIDTPLAPPAWAVLERELLRANTAACREYFERYFDDRGYLECVERWGGDDGPDDAIENCNDWPILHALGASDEVFQMYAKAWEGHLRQYTEAKTVQVELARDGMYYKEFPVSFDWMHNGEGLTVFNLYGLSDPRGTKFQQRVRRYAGFYMNEDPGAPNYDPQHKIIRSLFNGSRGPLMRKSTGLDWAGDPIEVENRFQPGHGERTYQEMLDHFKDYNDIVGDHPQNLLTTSLALNAFMLTQEPKYRQWLLEYVDAWRERTLSNGGVIPSNIGLDGTIGGETGGKWYGGVYGWGFTVINPVDGQPAHRNRHPYAITGFGNALLLTGDQRYVDLWRNQIQVVNSHAMRIDGRMMYPKMYGDDGWYAFDPEPYSVGAMDVYFWSMKPEDRARLGRDPWIEFLEGNNPDYPERALRADFARIRERVEGQRADTSTPDTRLADDPMKYNPASVRSLIELMLGGLHPGHQGSPLHCRLRYFDPVARRPGMPDDVAALVEKLSDRELTVQLVNVNQTEPRDVIVQTGAYGEHLCTSVVLDGREVAVNRPHFNVRLAPGSGERLTVKATRYASVPTLARPWDRNDGAVRRD